MACGQGLKGAEGRFKGVNAATRNRWEVVAISDAVLRAGPVRCGLAAEMPNTDKRRVVAAEDLIGEWE